MKRIILQLLAQLAKKIIKRHRPYIVAVTGTVGKTTATNFVYDFLHALYGDRVYISPYNYNGEYGVPFTIFQVQSPYRNPFLWVWVFIKGFLMLFARTYPGYIVLEYGIDRENEMDFLVDIARPDLSIILNISKNHVVSFPVFSKYIKEKMKIATGSKKLIVNTDDKNIMSHLGDIPTQKEVIGYGIKNQEGEFYAKDIEAGLEQLSFTLVYKGEAYEMSYPLIGEYQAYNILPVFAVGIGLGIDIPTIRELLADIHPQKGRGSILKGVRESIIVDGSYNGGFNSISGGITYLKKLDKEYNKILFIGDMRELGEESKALHTEIAESIVAAGIQWVVLVGEEMKHYVYPILLEHLGADNVFAFLNSRLAGEKVRDIIMGIENEEKTVVFVKGSQNSIYLEEGIKEFLYDLRDVEKLCRQDSHWIGRKNHFFETVIAEI
ncbi:MAG: UDP-N-acetylmuramoyl-tripeptide--D-alanyl-D-alanine ligase [Candidatus Gracilibacteria bacterium]|nr:UDP-N-acetylmuramoyl-tripeptide--D-alanyl-D-alanine ligase [Candidatus Gracilibacteria bacterium]